MQRDPCAKPDSVVRDRVKRKRTPLGIPSYAYPYFLRKMTKYSAGLLRIASAWIFRTLQNCNMAVI